MAIVFLDRHCVFDANIGYPPTAEEGVILTLPRMAQLESFLYNSICMADLPRIQTYSHATPSTSENLIEAINTISECALLIISGHTSTNDTCIFGAFIARPAVDGPCIHDGRSDYEETALLFQLSPIHDVFRGRKGKAAWSLTTNGIEFGRKGFGVALTIDNALSNGVLSHIASQPSNKATYSTTESRGSFEILFRVKSIELWGET